MPKPDLQSTRVATIKDLARLAGVSHTTVSMALRGTNGVSAARREQILKLAARHHFQPTVAAQILRGNKTGQIGLILGSESGVLDSSGFFMPVMTGFVHTCEAQQVGYHIEFFAAASRPEGFQPPHQLAGGLVDGALVVGFVDAQLRAWLGQQDKYPWVSLDEPGPISVMSAVDVGVAQAVQHLAALGHRRIAWAGGPTKYSTHRLSREGFLRAMAEYDLDMRADAWVAELALESRENAMAASLSWARELLRSKVSTARPTAVFCHDMRTARALIYAAMERGLRVPEDLSVVAGGTADDAEKGWPPLSTIEYDFPRLTAKGIELLRQRIANRESAGGEHWITPKMVLRQTVSRAPRGAA